jgi:hypothetical protein
MSTTRQAPRGKPRGAPSQPAAQQSSAQSMSGRERQMDDTDRQRNALDNQGAQGRHPTMTLREEEDDDTATRH